MTNLELVMAEAPVVVVRTEKERRGRYKGRRKDEHQRTMKKKEPPRRSW